MKVISLTLSKSLELKINYDFLLKSSIATVLSVAIFFSTVHEKMRKMSE